MKLPPTLIHSVLASVLIFGMSTTAAEAQSMALSIFGSSQDIIGPDRNPHDIIIPANFVLQAGKPVTVTVVNYDEGPHTIMAPGLNLNQTIKAGMQVGKTIKPVTTTFTFTPMKKGNFRWHCMMPCDTEQHGWAMRSGYGGHGKEGFMAGEIVVR